MTEQRQLRPRELYVGLGLAAAALAVAITGGVIAPASWSPPTQSPTIFPAACLFGLVVCGLIIARGSAASSTMGAVVPISLRALGVGMIMAVYALALPHIGLTASTVALVVVLPVLFGYSNWAAIALVAAILVGSSWLIFIRLMDVQLTL